MAHQKGLVPIFPLWDCMGYMTEEEVAKDLSRVVHSWAKRSSRLWLCLAPECTDVDTVTHDALLYNEGHMRADMRHYKSPSRLPVYRFWVDRSGNPVVRVVERHEVSEILRKNIMSGLFRGYADTAERSGEYL